MLKDRKLILKEKRDALKALKDIQKKYKLVEQALISKGIDPESFLTEK